MYRANKFAATTVQSVPADTDIVQIELLDRVTSIIHPQCCGPSLNRRAGRAVLMDKSVTFRFSGRRIHYRKSDEDASEQPLFVFVLIL
jgi:hypothetical protein